MTKSIVAGVLLAAALAAAPLWANAAEDAPHCGKPEAPATQNIHACLAAIAANKAKPREAAADYFDLADAYEAFGDRVSEVNVLSKAVALIPNWWQPRLHRAQLYLGAQKTDDAMADYLVLVHDHPGAAAPQPPALPPTTPNSSSKPPPITDAARLAMGLNSLKMQLDRQYLRRCEIGAQGGLDLAGAIKACDTALQIDPSAIMAYQVRGIAEFRRADWSHAMADFDVILKKQPDVATARYLKGITENRMGKVAEANADLAAARARNPRIEGSAIQFGLLP